MQEIAIVAVLLLLGMGAYWSMVIFPKQREFQKRQRFVRALAEGDEVITAETQRAYDRQRATAEERP